MINDLPPEGEVVLELETFLGEVGRPVRPPEAYRKLADKFGLSNEQRARLMPDGRNHWENRVQFARRKLNDMGKLDRGVGNGLWALGKV
jgi:restriction endonuclease Mrr